MKHQVYDNILVRRSGVDYSPGIRFETSLVNVDEEKSLTTSNQLEKSNQKQKNQCRCGFIKHLRVTSKNCPVGLAIRKAKKMVLGMGLYQDEAKKAA